jgi:hypothetical protein
MNEAGELLGVSWCYDVLSAKSRPFFKRQGVNPTILNIVSAFCCGRRREVDLIFHKGRRVRHVHHRRIIGK